MAQPPRSLADELRFHIAALTAHEQSMRLGQHDSIAEVGRICVALGTLFPPPAPRPVNPPLAITRHGAVW